MKKLMKLLSTLSLVVVGFFVITANVDEGWLNIYLPIEDPTPTPFQPLPPTPTPEIVKDLVVGGRKPEKNFYQTQGLKFDEGKSVAIEFRFPGKTITVTFIPKAGYGLECGAGVGYSCVYAMREAIIPFIHTGLYRGKRETAEELRRLIEGVYIWDENKGNDDEEAVLHYEVSKTLEEIQETLDSLAGTEATVIIDGMEVEYTLALVIRVPPSLVSSMSPTPKIYSNVVAMEIPELAGRRGEPLILPYFCGWRVRSEEWVEGTKEISWSRYIFVLVPKDR